MLNFFFKNGEADTNPVFLKCHLYSIDSLTIEAETQIQLKISFPKTGRVRCCVRECVDVCLIVGFLSETVLSQLFSVPPLMWLVNHSDKYVHVCTCA